MLSQYDYKQNGDRYPPNSLYLLFYTVNRYLKNCETAEENAN